MSQVTAMPLHSTPPCFLGILDPSDELKEPLRRDLTRISRFACSNLEYREDRLLARRINTLLGTAPQLPIVRGEAWSDRALKDLKGDSPDLKRLWVALLEHAGCATGGKATAKWQKAATARISAIGETAFRDRIFTWFTLVDKPRTNPRQQDGHGRTFDPSHIIDPHADLLKGLAWCCAGDENPETTRALSALAISAYKKIPGIGPRNVKIGNACVAALGSIPTLDAVGQLALLKVRVKAKLAQKGIAKALDRAAAGLQLPREDLEEMVIPTYGLTEVGSVTEPLGDFTAELRVTGTTTTELRWIKPDGKSQKSIPVAVKNEFPAELRELKQAAKDIQKMLPAQRDRIDQLFLKKKTWDAATWRARYLDHPLVGTLARRLIWCFTHDGRTVSACFHEGSLLDQEGIELDRLDDSVTVSLWHPLESELDEVLAWRTRLEELEIQQPFKQAHREVYRLTDAERSTGIYSNRFAAHVLKQHQFNALCLARGWHNQLRLLVDDSYPPASIEVPDWGLRAEFWIDGIGDVYGTDTNETGTFLHLATDQVRFYPSAAGRSLAHTMGTGYEQPADSAPVRLDDVPALVLTEILRDVDLFVGVSSIGNDPAWTDGGRIGHVREYWTSFSFGELSETALTRKATLERLVPRLKIADRCELRDRFLVVRGKIRTYKIHLKSGNILMEPNDEYLCIVPGRSPRSNADKLFLPFEGDGLLGIILSKAFLLADDDKIEDATILQQIRLGQLP